MFLARLPGEKTEKKKHTILQKTDVATSPKLLVSYNITFGFLGVFFI